MNKTKRTVSLRLNKKMHKEIKAAQRPLAPDARQYSDTLTPDLILKKYPKKTVKAEKGMLKGLEERFGAIKSKKMKKHSKRTNCAKVDEKSPPAHIHVEGVRWIKNLKNQTSDQRRRTTKQTAKRK
jgi:hypothetical protein